MSVAYRSTVRHEVKTEEGIPVRIRRPAKNLGDCATGRESKIIEGHLVDISENGLKIRSHFAFSFHEKLLLELPQLNWSEPLVVAVEVRWTQPDHNIEETWSTGCVISESFPDGYVDELARNGYIDRRESSREDFDQIAQSKIESVASSHEVVIVDVSAHGIGLRSPVPVEVGRRMQLEFRDKNQDGKLEKLTLRTIRTRVVDGGYFVGCKVLKGSTYRILGQSLSATITPPVPVNRVFKSLNLLCMIVLILFIIREFFHLL